MTKYVEFEEENEFHNDYDEEFDSQEFKKRYLDFLKNNQQLPVPSIINNPYFKRGFYKFMEAQEKFKVPKVKKKSKQTRKFGLGV